MSKNIYKYAGFSYLDKVISANDICTLKCSYPNDFNDPYELFLTIDFKERPEALALYSDVIGDLPQLPTTCFSRSPSVIPMWAHYAQNLQGFAIEFNESKLIECFPESGFGDIDYSDSANDSLNEMLNRAYEIGKPRYFHMLRKGVFSAAYYTKATCWNYEQERRMIVQKSEIRSVDNLMLMDVPKECVTTLICGPRASSETMRAVREKAIMLGCRYFELKVGKSSAVPYFINSEGESFTFNGTDIEPSLHSCMLCKEPLLNKNELCSWCQIDESHVNEAKARNTYRMLDHYGLLSDYIKGMQDIDNESNPNR